MSTTIDNVKASVKAHQIIPFRVQDISCDRNSIIIGDRYSTADAKTTKSVMETLGIRSNLSKDIFEKPEQNWNIIRTALNAVDQNRIYNCITNDSDAVRTMISTTHKEIVQLDYDNRIDQLIDTINGANSKHTFKDILFDPSNCSVQISSIKDEEVDCGAGDLWKFGTSTSLTHNSQQFANYFLRLVCTNGMTTRENLAYRVADSARNLGKQFLKFADSTGFANSIKPRVTKLRNTRASLNEVMSVASVLNKDQKAQYMPEYAQIVADFKNRDISIDKISAKRRRFVYTNENLYDVFNLATNLASHSRDEIGVDVAMNLNRVAAEIFSKGPNLEFNLLDIYSNN
jgi:hypothetical protein